MRLFALHGTSVDALSTLLDKAIAADEQVELHASPQGWEFQAGEMRLLVLHQGREDEPNEVRGRS